MISLEKQLLRNTKCFAPWYPHCGYPTRLFTLTSLELQDFQCRMKFKWILTSLSPTLKKVAKLRTREKRVLQKINNAHFAALLYFLSGATYVIWLQMHTVHATTFICARIHCHSANRLSILRWNQCIANERTVDQTANECFPLEMWTNLTVIDLFIFIEMFSGSYIVDILPKKKKELIEKLNWFDKRFIFN